MAKVTKIIYTPDGASYFFTDEGEAFGFAEQREESIARITNQIERGVGFLPATIQEKKEVIALGIVVWEAE